MESNLQSVMERKSYVELAGNGGYFSKFEYIEDDYNNYKKDLTKRRENHQKAMEKIGGGAPFLTMPNRALPHKHESYFRSLMFQPYDSLAVGFLSQDDPYEANAFEVLRAKWMNDSKMLYGDFKAS